VYLRKKILTQSSIYNSLPTTIIYIDISGECNWGCSYCNAPYKYATGDVSRALQISKLFELRKISYDSADVRFIITGGEPSIYGIEYNQNIIKSIRRLHKTPVPIEYVSNLSAPVDFYIELDVDSFLFSYHLTQISFEQFITKFEQVLSYKNSFIRATTLDKESLTNKILNYNPNLLERIVWYTINDIDGENLFAEYNTTNVYELTQGTLWKANS
jgi:organic radical activating enzyme